METCFIWCGNGALRSTKIWKLRSVQADLGEDILAKGNVMRHDPKTESERAEFQDLKESHCYLQLSEPSCGFHLEILFLPLA